MMDEFEVISRLDYRRAKDLADPRLSFENLFSSGRGNMFGVMECEDTRGKIVVLRAFSSLWDGIRQVDGWVMPILSAEIYDRVILPAQSEIKIMTALMKESDPESVELDRIREQRKGVSQVLWKKMCDAYRFRNFRGEERSLEDALLPGAPVTGGVGECCAPKLLNHAALHDLRPIGLAEFYWAGGGRGASSAGGGRRVVGEFYPSCEARCRPILGFMLCGLEA